jgi:phosphomevalonate kinase
VDSRVPAKAEVLLLEHTFGKLREEHLLQNPLILTPQAAMSTAVSAPGKVFLAGGYLVLDRAYTALVFGLSARIHILVNDIESSSGVQLSEIVVQSPQFRDATWNYGYHLAEDQGGIQVTQLQG